MIKMWNVCGHIFPSFVVIVWFHVVLCCSSEHAAVMRTIRSSITLSAERVSYPHRAGGVHTVHTEHARARADFFHISATSTFAPFFNFFFSTQRNPDIGHWTSSYCTNLLASTVPYCTSNFCLTP